MGLPYTLWLETVIESESSHLCGGLFVSQITSFLLKTSSMTRKAIIVSIILGLLVFAIVILSIRLATTKKIYTPPLQTVTTTVSSSSDKTSNSNSEQPITKAEIKTPELKKVVTSSASIVTPKPTDNYDLDIQGAGNTMTMHITAPNAMTSFAFIVTLLDNGVPTDKTPGDIVFKITNSSPQLFPEIDIYPTETQRLYATKYVYDSNGTRTQIRYLTFTRGYEPTSLMLPAGTYYVTFSVPALNIVKTVPIQVVKDY